MILSAVLPECRSCPEIFPAFSPRWYARAFRSRGDTSLGAYPIRTVIQFFQGASVTYKHNLAKKRYPFPYIQKVGKVRKNAWISTLRGF